MHDINEEWLRYNIKHSLQWGFCSPWCSGLIFF